LHRGDKKQGESIIWSSGTIQGKVSNDRFITMTRNFITENNRSHLFPVQNYFHSKYDFTQQGKSQEPKAVDQSLNKEN